MHCDNGLEGSHLYSTHLYGLRETCSKTIENPTRTFITLQHRLVKQASQPIKFRETTKTHNSVNHEARMPSSGPSPLAIGVGVGGAVLVVVICLWLGWTQRRSQRTQCELKSGERGGRSRKAVQIVEPREPERAYRSVGYWAQ